MGDTLLKVINLHTHFDTQAGDLRAVDGVSFEINSGETVAILGESGCGKSISALSLLQLVPEPAGRIVSGEIRLDGENLLKLPEMAMRDVRGRRIAMIFQEPQSSLNPVMTVGEQIAEVFDRDDYAHMQEQRAAVVHLLKQVGISDPERRIDEYPHQMSGGMKQRAMIAMALACKPDILIADEPTTALDVTIQKQILDLLRDIQKQTGMSILLITHDLGVVAQLAHRVLVMYAGQLVEAQDTGSFFAAPRHPYSEMLFRALPGRGKRGAALAMIPGMVPPLTQEFSGCRFVDRCRHAQQHCRDTVPHWDGDLIQGVRCHFPVAAGSQDKPASAVIDQAGGDSQILLTVNDLKVYFPIQRGVFRHTIGYIKAVDGVSFTLAAGRTLALVGESGCGKTTAGKGLLQLTRPTAGEVVYAGKNLVNMDARSLRNIRSDIQIIFQDPYASLNPRMLVGDIIEEGMKSLLNIEDSNDRRQRVQALLERVGLPATAAQRYPHEFSGGQRQRISIARALAVEPRLIVCDEPTSALDVSVQAQVLNLLKQLQDELGLTYLFITHDLSVVEYLAHDIAVMYLGRIVESGSVADILDSPRHPYTQALLAAIPVLQPDGNTETGLASVVDVPSPSNPPTGCYFHPRCNRAMPQCAERYPEVTGTGHKVACHLYTGADE